MNKLIIYSFELLELCYTKAYKVSNIVHSSAIAR